MPHKKIAIFASGSGSNAQKIAEYFKDHPAIKVSWILSNHPKAGVIDRAQQLSIPVRIFNRKEFYSEESILHFLQDEGIDLIVLAGFLWLIPEYFVEAFPQKMVNIHPSLLPKYGGKGMYGHYVHEAVHKAGEKESGITVHYVNAQYDEGDIIFQTSCALTSDDQPDDIALKVRALEHEYFPKVIERILNK